MYSLSSAHFALRTEETCSITRNATDLSLQILKTNKTKKRKIQYMITGLYRLYTCTKQKEFK